MANTIKSKVYNLLERSSAGNRLAQQIDAVLIVFIVVNVGLAVLETEPSIGDVFSREIFLLDFVVGSVFAVEYLLRLWVSDLHPPLKKYGSLKARLVYALQPLTLIDFLAVMPFWLSLFFAGISWKSLVILRLLRFLKIARYSPAVRSLISAVVEEKKAIIGSLVLIFGVALVAATLLYSIEHAAQPEYFGTIPAALWWAFSTLTTVGYGDVVPVTALGKFVASIVMLMGYCLFALPVGIVGTAFAREIHSREFVVTWGMVATVPLFERLSAVEIAAVTELLHSHSVPAGQYICEKGEDGDSLYLIASGQVEEVFERHRVVHNEGEHFGEASLFGHSKRTASAIARTPAQLMVLKMEDLRRFMDRKPAVAKKIIAEAIDERKAHHVDVEFTP
ncbi:Cyclic nucleotide-gated potassium channel [Pseudovibrio axinellae]|uniref:Cyclic nucleotide-gated potassium channel n=1 Tax=Pseudovibrio axinellae TaxID=989403 RepID=A0A166AN05_9HYPH|nr:cyclic nucleotide-gated ion channel [Pseudovibrio axinellae]KZL21327.1 Cyclic nucleotide-gated potassium channel [Pseudovibrio axinellae]SEQ96258.1 voltage-gated potassium channel [Pseudovibrio axinellae]